MMERKSIHLYEKFGQHLIIYNKKYKSAMPTLSGSNLLIFIILSNH